MTSKLKTDVLETVSGSGTIALTNQLSGMTSASMPSGSVIQVVQGTDGGSDTSTSSTSWVASNIWCDITPTSTTSKILVSVNTSMYIPDGAEGAITIYRNSTEVTGTSNGISKSWFNGTRGTAPAVGSFLDSPSLTSTITYRVYFRSINGSYSVDCPVYGGKLSSSITITEIKG
jgi:hypothetical protein